MFLWDLEQWWRIPVFFSGECFSFLYRISLIVALQGVEGDLERILSM